jgi:p-cumate 2,3-dioxygenase subunit beta
MATHEVGATPVDRQRVEAFLYEEAYLLDEWQLDDWLALFTEDARYVVPATDLPDGDPSHDLVLIDDDKLRLGGRVERLKSRRAHREYPWSRTRRLVTNVRVVPTDEGDVGATASFAVYRIRSGHTDVFVGQYRYVLVEAEEGLRIRYRRATLDLESLSPHGAVSMIL